MGTTLWEGPVVNAMRWLMPCGGLWKTWIVRIVAVFQIQAGAAGCGQ